MSDSEGDSEPAKASRPRALRGKARIAAAYAQLLASSSETAVAETVPTALDSLAKKLNDIAGEINDFESTSLVFLDRAVGVDGVGIIDRDDVSSRVFASHQRSVALACEALQGAIEDPPEEDLDHARIIDVLGRALDLHDQLSRIKEHAWREFQTRASLAALHGAQTYDNSSAFSRRFRKNSGAHLMYAFILVCTHLLLHTTVGVSQKVLYGLDLVCTSAMFAASATRVPHDLRTVLSWFPLDANIQSIACCPNPECCKLHPADDARRLPERCDAAFGGWKCNWSLSTSHVAADGTLHVRPLREFHFQSIKSWVGHLLARPGLEQKMEDYVHTAITSESPSFWDIWHTAFFRPFVWGSSTAGTGFDVADGGQLRLLFSLAIDWFTAHGGKQAGKKWSIGAIYLVCHNLPLEVRFLPENICLVGIIPGRTKPLGHAINWFLQILVNELVAFYERGVWYTQTAKYPTGRLVWAALGPVVCDLDAARGIAGFGSVGHNLLCTICDVTRSTISDFRAEFGPRGGPAAESFPLWTRFVDLWTRATTVKEQESLWTAYGMRWTELSRLRYWNPFQYLVIDPMHNLFLGLFKRHLRVIWGMNVDMTGWGDEIQLPAGQLAYAKQVFAREDCSASRLESLAVGALHYLARACGTIPDEAVRGKKKDLAQALFNWKEDTLASTISTPPVLLVSDEEEALALDWLLTQPKTWSKMSKFELLELCQAADVVVVGDESKDDLVGVLKNFLEERERLAADAAAEDEEEDVDPSVRPATGKRKPKVVLGRGILSAASKDIRRTVLPDWLDPAPVNIGSSKHGKLSANNWRVFCTIHCIITLIRLWGSSARDTKPFRALENYLYLVKAVELATMRSTIKTRWETYTKHMVHYLEGLKEVYPNVVFTPNHHLATHLAQFLRRFGPPHSWWAFPYERYNGMLQKINTNDIIGSMEKTMLTKFIQAAHLQWLIADGNVPKILRSHLDWARGLVRDAYAGNLLMENDAAALSGDWSVEPCDARPSKAIRKLLKDSPLHADSVVTAKSVQRRGMTFAASAHIKPTASPGNSIVHVRLGNDTAPGEIREIVYRPPDGKSPLREEDVHVWVNLYDELSDADKAKDPYRPWRRLGDYQGIDCHLRYTSLGRPQLVPVANVLCHAARCQYEVTEQERQLAKPAFAFVGLHRVRFYYIMEQL